jgi:hypothetical protein
MLFQKTVDKIVADINRKAILLEKLAAREVERAAKFEEAAKLAAAQADAARKEQERAVRLAGRFAELLA